MPEDSPYSDWRVILLKHVVSLIERFVTALLCLIEGTLFGSDPSRRYFVQDGWNIFLYVFVCPTYVALSCWLIALTITKWSALANYADQKTGIDFHPRSPHRLYGVFFVAFLLCTVFITNYMYDILNPAPEDAERARVYWFVRALSDGTPNTKQSRILLRRPEFFASLHNALGSRCLLVPCG
jgi:hypothetical protein